MKLNVEIDYDGVTDYIYNLEQGDIFCIDRNYKGVVSHIFMLTSARNIVNLENGDVWKDLDDFCEQMICPVRNPEQDVWIPVSVELYVKMRGRS